MDDEAQEKFERVFIKCMSCDKAHGSLNGHINVSQFAGTHFANAKTKPECKSPAAKGVHVVHKSYKATHTD